MGQDKQRGCVTEKAREGRCRRFGRDGVRVPESRRRRERGCGERRGGWRAVWRTAGGGSRANERGYDTLGSLRLVVTRIDVQLA